MRLRYGLLALLVEVGVEGRLSMLGGDITAFQVESFPAIQPSITVVSSVVAAPVECGKPHVFHLEMVDSTGNVLFKTEESDFTPRLNPWYPQDDVDVGLLSVIESLPLPSPGRYIMRVFIDHEKPIDVVRFYAGLSSMSEVKT